MHAFSLGRRLITAVTVALAALVPLQAATAQAGGIAVGASVPAIGTLDQLDGGQFDLSKAVGARPVVLEFWATWCPLCRKLEPAMQAAQKRYGDRVAFVGIGVPDNQTAERQRQYVSEHQLSGVYVFDREHAATKAFQVPHTSYVVVLDAAGKVVYTGVGGEQDIDAALQRALPAR